MYINVHTHHPAGTGIEIENVNIRKTNAIPESGLYSVGLHPWWINEVNVEQILEVIKEFCLHQNCLAIGEIGLDRFAAAGMELQTEIFTAQLQIAKEYNKPVIIHSVRSHQAIAAIYQKGKFDFPLVFHGFNSNFNIARTLMQKNFYFSFGKALLQESSNASGLLRNLDLNHVFFENDNEIIPVDRIYSKASEILKIGIDDLCSIIQKNFEKVFYI